MFSIIQYTEFLQEQLQNAMNDLPLRWKTTDSTSEYSEAVPTVYSFTYDDLDGLQPLKTPSVLVQVLSLSEGIINYLIHCCVCNPAMQDKELTVPVEKMDNVYSYSTGTEISSAVVRSELYKAALLLGERVYLAIQRIENNGVVISDLSLQTPSPYMEEFPYCSCTISFNAEIQQTAGKIDTDLWKYL